MDVRHDGVDVVLRFHDLSRFEELERAVFSLVGQEFRPLRILLCLQRFSDDDVTALREKLGHLFLLLDAPELVILRHDAPYPKDARSALINLGFAAATGRYLTILDYDDLLYPEAYRMLAARLEETGAAIAFAGIGIRHVDVHAGFAHVTSAATAFAGSDLVDLFRQNFCPIHSFMLDRTRVPIEEMRFDLMMTIEEDYEFLLRVCARLKSDFSLVGTMIGEYFYKSNDSNTVTRTAGLSTEMLERISHAQAFNQARRNVSLISAEVQASLGLAEFHEGLTIQRFLADYAR